MRTQNLVTILCCLLLPFSLTGQRSISGKVLDEQNEPLTGTTVFVQDFARGAIVTDNGSYRLEVPEGARFLEFRFIGYAERVVEIGAKDVINVTMRTKATFLEQVVITGLATGTPTTKVGFNIAKVSNDQLKEVPGVNVATALQGKVPGMMIVGGIGQPGTNASIRIRGTNNFYGFLASPLIIVDGILLQDPANLTDINTEDVQSIEVIKGAAATSLYGSRAGNGVINIMTKRGSGQMGVTEITLRNELGANFLPRQVPVNQHHHFGFDSLGNVDYMNEDEDMIADNVYPQLYDQQALYFDPGRFMTNSLSIGHRTEETNYFLSLNNTQQTGVVPLKQGFRRQSLRANIDHQISKSLKLRFSNYYAQSTRDDPDNIDPFVMLLLSSPAVDLSAPNEEDGSPYNHDANSIAGYNTSNPLYDLNSIDIEQQTDRYSGSLGLTFTPLPFLSLEGVYTLDRRSVLTDAFIDKGYLPSTIFFDGVYDRGSIKRSYQTATGKLTFNERFSQFRLTSQAAVIYEDDAFRSFNVRAFDMRFNGIRSLDNSGNFSTGDPDEPDVNRTERGSRDFDVRTLNYYLTGKVDWKDKLIVDGLVRFDGSSLFGLNNRWNTFYRTSLVYRLGEDLNAAWIQELKLRASYGTAGNRPGFDYRFETLNSDGTKNTLGNEDLRSSLQRELEVGLDAQLWKRISLSLTYARTTSSDMFYNVPLPSASGGFKSQWQNLDSEFLTHSIEASLGINVIQKKDVDLSVNFVFDRVRQKVVRFEFGNLSTIYPLLPGESVGAIGMVEFARSEADLYPYQREGKTFVVNHEGWLVEADKLGTVDERPIQVIDEAGNERFIQGDVMPDFNLGFRLNARWKGLQAYCLLHWQQGGDIFNFTRQVMFRDLRHGDFDQSGRPENEKKPVGYYSGFYAAARANNYFLEDGSYLKMRELAISYSFNTDSWGSVGEFIKGLKLSFVGRNLFTLTNYTGYDPETAFPDAQEDATLNRADIFGYPNFRTITGAVEIRF